MSLFRLAALLRGGAAALSLSLGLIAAPAAAADTIPMRDFFRNPEKAGFEVSPDGKSIAFLQPWESRLNIHVQTRGSNEVKRVTEVKDRDIRQYLWKGNDYLVYLKDSGGDENFHVYVVDRQGKGTRELTPFDKVRAGIINPLVDSDEELLVGLNKRNPQLFDVYRLNVRTGDLKLEVENPGGVSQWVADHDGKVRAAIKTDGVNQTLLYRATEKDAFKPVLTTDFRSSMTPAFFTFDNQRLYAMSNLGRDRQAAVEFDPATAKVVKVIYEHPEVDVSALRYSPKRKVLTVAGYITAKAERHFFDPEFETIYHRVKKALPNYQIDFVSVDRAEQVMTLAATSDRSRGTYYLYERQGDKLTKLADLSPWLAEDKLAQMLPIQYKSRDGLTINGYLTLPPGKPAKHLPVVINPHGGPWARDVWRFNPEVQFLANRGYAVLQMNFRGSTGYGRKFWEASFKQWGKTMQDDVSDGVKHLVAQGIADPKRVCIYGGSYGGYATLAGLAFSPELYACGVDYVGVSNLFTFLKTIPPYWKPYLDMLHEMVGHPEKDKALLEATSPAMHADKMRAPLLVAQGAKDPRVNIDESNQIVAALKKKGVDVPYLVKDNEGHGFSNEENRFEFYEAMEKFLAKHLGS
ncbi:MAG: S9 family peptidase [Betaproteobacteria bacterium]|nr:S9 family peptidase [Betaproteobacteria bacterium]